MASENETTLVAPQDGGEGSRPEPASQPAAPSSSPESSSAQTPETHTPAAIAETKPKPDGGLLGMIEAVRPVLQPKPLSPAEPSQNPQGSPSDGGASSVAANPASPDPDENKALTVEDLSDIQKPSIKRRMAKLLERDFQSRQEIEAMRPEVEAWTRTKTFCQDNGIGPQDLNLLLGVGALIGRQDYRAALDTMLPYVHALQAAAGDVLPADMVQRVDAGELTEDAARELTRSRADAANARTRLEATHQAQQAERDRATQAQVQQTVMDVTTSWETQIRQRDPDYARKADFMVDALRSINSQHGYPRNADEAIQRVNAAYTAVNQRFASMRPAAQPTRLQPPSVNGNPSHAAPAPRNMEEAIRGALRLSAR